MTDVALDDLLVKLDDRVKTELESTPDVQDKGHALDVNALPITARVWHKVIDVVAVSADLKNSSQLGTSMHAASTASVYEWSGLTLAAVCWVVGRVRGAAAGCRTACGFR